MSRRTRDFRTEKELCKFFNSESKDDGDFSSDNNDYNSDIEIKILKMTSK